MNKRFEKKDVIFLAVAISVIGVICIGVYLIGTQDGKSVQIEVNGNLYGTYDLDKNQTIPIKNENGIVTNVLKIQNGKATMTEADCPDKLCVHQKAISHANESIICLPNKIVVTVKSKEQELDGVAN